MAPKRPFKGDDVSPDDLPIPGGGGVSSDKFSDVYQRLGSLQSSVTYLEGHADDASKDLKSITADIVAAKATFKTLKNVFAVVGSICVAFWALITGLVIMMAKHYLGW